MHGFIIRGHIYMRTLLLAVTHISQSCSPTEILEGSKTSLIMAALTDRWSFWRQLNGCLSLLVSLRLIRSCFPVTGYLAGEMFYREKLWSESGENGSDTEGFDLIGIVEIRYCYGSNRRDSWRVVTGSDSYSCLFDEGNDEW